MVDADVAVIGLGAIGSMTAWRLAQQGASVHGYEQFGLGHDRGASSGQTRRFSVQSQGDPRFTPFAVRAGELWRELEEQTGTALLHTVGGVIIGHPEAPGFANAVASARLHGLDHEVITGREVAERYPQHRIDRQEQAVYDPWGGYLRPELAVVTAGRRAAQLGAELFAGTRVLDLRPDADGVEVRTSEGARRYGRVVVSTGSWARVLLPELRGTVLPRRLVQAWFLAEDPAAYRADRFPVFERLGEVLSYGFPSLDEVTVKVGLRLTEHPAVQDVDRPSREVSPATMDRFAAAIQRILPGLHPYPVATALGFEGYTPDGRALLGPAPSHARVIAAVGFSGSGFKFAPFFGDVAAALALGRPRPDVDFLSPQRPLSAWDPVLTTPV